MNVAVEDLMHRDELLGSFFPRVSIACLRAINSTLGTDSRTCSPTHLPQAERRLANAEVDELG